MSRSILPYCARVIPCMLLAASGFVATAGAQVDEEINKSVWKQKFGVLDAQMNEQPPYAGWLSQDADGDGVNNRSRVRRRDQSIPKTARRRHFRPPVVAAGPIHPLAHLSRPCRQILWSGKQHESRGRLVEGLAARRRRRWHHQNARRSEERRKIFPHRRDRPGTQGDQVSDWAKHVLGLSPAAPITSQTSYDLQLARRHSKRQNVVSLAAIDTVATQPPDSSAPRQRLRGDPGHPLGLHAAWSHHRAAHEKRNRRGGRRLSPRSPAP